MNQKTAFFMMFLFAIGIVLAWVSGQIDNAIKADCRSDKLLSANKGVLVIGVIFIVSSASYLMCHMRCTCGEEEGEGSKLSGLDTFLYLGFAFLLGIVLIILGSMIHGYTGTAGCEKARRYAPSIWGMGVLMVVSTGAYLGYQGLQMSGGIEGLKAMQAPKAAYSF